MNVTHPDQRSTRPWALIKDEILKGFLPIYTQAMIKRRKLPLLIDGYAGPGVYEDGSLGSPMIMLNETYRAFELVKRINDFKKIVFYFCEKDNDYKEALRNNVSDFIKSHAGSEIGQIYYSEAVKGQVNFPPPGPELFSTLGFSGEGI